MDILLTRGTLPSLPDTPPSLSDRLVKHAGAIRYHWLRMPPKLLAQHLLHKMTSSGKG
jgi:hypothetical protein